MQFVKDEIKQRIMHSGREEFLKNGFERASIRNITARAKTSKSNLYNYFVDKDDLFCSILQPTLLKIRAGLDAARSYALMNGLDLYTEDAQRGNINAVIKFVAENLTDLQLLLFHAQGSSLAYIRDDIADTFTDIIGNWIEANMPDKEISRFFIRSVTIFYINIIEQFMLEATSKEQPEKHYEEFIRFIYYGWKGVFQ